MAQLLSATWRETRHSVLEYGMVPQFQFRQFLFACQARILSKLHRHIEVRFTVLTDGMPLTSDTSVHFYVVISHDLERCKCSSPLRCAQRSVVGRDSKGASILRHKQHTDRARSLMRNP